MRYTAHLLLLLTLALTYYDMYTKVSSKVLLLLGIYVILYVYT